MNIYLKSLAIVLALALGVQSSFASTSKGDVEISGLFYYSSPEDGDPSGSLNGSIGYFYTDRIELKLSSFISFGKDTSGSLGPGLEYFFNPGADVLYSVGGSYQLDVSSNESAEDSWEAHVGFKNFLTERVSIDGRIGYQDFDVTTSTYALLGISYFF